MSKKPRPQYRLQFPVSASRKMKNQARAILGTGEFREFEKTIPPLPEDPGPEASDVKKREYELLRQACEVQRQREITAFVARKVGLK